MNPAIINMKAMVAARLLLGDFANWEEFEENRKIASQITNRQIARRVWSQSSYDYGHIKREVSNFIDKNFVGCEFRDLARLCDDVKCSEGIFLRLDEFEQSYFLLAESVKRRFPFYAHVHISPFGLQFEFPEHHFLRDMETSLPDLLEISGDLAVLSIADAKRNRDSVAKIVSREKFLSRSLVSSSFSLVEAFLSGLFYVAVQTKAFGDLNCDEQFLRYAATKESAPLKDRLDRAVRFASEDKVNGTVEPFKSLIEFGKRYRDAIHHTTPFQRKDVEPGGRLTALYQVRDRTALRCISLSCEAILKILDWSHSGISTGDIAVRCREILEKSQVGERSRAGRVAVLNLVE